MLKGISPILSPEMLKVLCEMGHGDCIVLGDGNFPAASMGKNATVLRCDGHSCAELLDAILQLFPLDPYVEKPVALMQIVPGDNVDPVIWKDYERVIKENEGEKEIEYIERFAFYERAKQSYCIVATGESALYANIILKKGVVK